MADLGHSVFAPYARTRPLADVAPAGAIGCDHPALNLSAIPPKLLNRQPGLAEDPATRRTRIWEFSQNLHCSIIGTCLSTAELRQTLTRLGLARTGWTDHDLHHKAVSLAARHDQPARLLHKALDRRHKLPVSQFAKARTEADLSALWRDAVRRGDIPGAYWAVLTHPATTPALVRLVFGEVHMLSHLVGAANRADIRRLCELEQRNAGLEDQLRRQQEALRQAVITRDTSISDLRQALRRRLMEQAPQAGDDSAALPALVADLEKRLGAESRRRAALETRLTETRDGLAQERGKRETAEAEARSLRAELAAVELDLRPESEPPAWRLDGMTVLYVGGRPNQVATLRALAKHRGAARLHHDGGVEQNADLLPGLTARADVVLFPVDCVSHEAALAVKRLCRQTGKRFIPLRSAGAASFLAALRPPAE